MESDGSRWPYVWFLDKSGRVPFKKSRKEQGSWAKVIYKWFLPGFFNGCCIFTSMWLLHIATYQYVHRMSSMGGALLSQNAGTPDAAANLIQDFGGLKDPLADVFPFESLSLATLDKVAAFFPGAFMLGMFLFDDLNLYTKIMFCNGLLALLKGTTDAMTIIPDSAGWEACQARLTPLGVSFFQGEHSFGELLYHEAVGVNGKHLRWCSDMLISGHTYFTTIFALGVYELSRKVTRQLPKNHIAKIASISFIVLLGIGEQILEVYFVTVDRFHYTMDIYMALVLTLLIYTNVIPAMIAKWWFCLGNEAPKDMAYVADVLESQADVVVPVCCFPFCCFSGRQHTFDDLHMANLIKVVAGKGNHDAATESKITRIREAALVGGGVEVASLWKLQEPLVSK